VKTRTTKKEKSIWRDACAENPLGLDISPADYPPVGFKYGL